MIEANPKLRPWRDAVTWHASEAVKAHGGFGEDGVALTLWFRFARPKSHLRADGMVRPAAPAFPGTTAGDIDKLSRGVIDAMTEAGCWRNDTQVVQLTAAKLFSPVAGLEVKAWSRDE